MHLIITLLIGLAGVAVFKLAHLPLPWLLGPMFACLTGALLKVRLAAWAPASHAMRTVLGIAIGATITPALLSQAGSMIVSVLMVPLFILCIAVMGFPLFRKVYGFDPATSYYAAMPGGLQDMLLFGEAAGGGSHECRGEDQEGRGASDHPPPPTPASRSLPRKKA